jgi:hypothetical protein
VTEITKDPEEEHPSAHGEMKDLPEEKRDIT